MFSNILWHISLLLDISKTKLDADVPLYKCYFYLLDQRVAPNQQINIMQFICNYENNTKNHFTTVFYSHLS